MKNKITLYDDFFGTFESAQYRDLKKRFDDDFEKNVVFEGYDFSKEGWFRSTVAAALNYYFNSFNLRSVKDEK